MSTRTITAFCALVAATSVVAVGTVSGEPKAPPRFRDYPAGARFTGRPVAPNLVTAAQHHYPTMIRQGVAEGWGVRRNGVEPTPPAPGPNFAGNMIVILWSCGAPCLIGAMTNAQTGDVSSLPLSVDDSLGLPFLVVGDSPGGNPELEFRQDSRLMIVSATPNSFRRGARAYKHYFAWESDHWVLVYRERLD